MRHALVCCLLALSACANAPPASDDGGPPPSDSGTSPPTALGPPDRRAQIIIPSAHDGVTRLPIAFLLHGYTADASVQNLYFRAGATLRNMGVYLVLPNGTVDAGGNRFWNATPACCDFAGTGVDDVAYLTSLLDEAESVLPIDTDRVYFFGHSNGGYMSYRMACERADRITAIASLAGADYPGDMDCVPSRPVSVLQVHGTLDDTVQFAGVPASYPSARTTVLRWAGRAGCDPATITSGAALDLDTALPGAETTVEQWTTGCMPGLDAELWTIEGGSHIPTLGPNWMPTLAAWMLSHSR